MSLCKMKQKEEQPIIQKDGGIEKTMKKLLFLILAIVIASTMVVMSCGEKETTTAAPTSAAPTSAAPTSAAPTSAAPTSAAPTKTSAAPTTTAAPAQPQPVTGGKLRIIYATAPKVLGGSIEQGPWDLFPLLVGAEKVMEYNDKQILAPWLAESVTIDDKAKTITIKLHPNIICHDGSVFDAAAMAWNYTNQVERKRMGYLDQWVSIDVKDATTAVINYKGDYNNQLVTGWIWSPPMYSKSAGSRCLRTISS